MKLSGWGRYSFMTLASRLLAKRRNCALVRGRQSLIACRKRRTYGDSAINKSAAIDMRAMNRTQEFDAETGQLAVELSVIISAFLPRGWFLMVTPGTKFATLSGAFASDAHSKNYHKDGYFLNSVDWNEVMGCD